MIVYVVTMHRWGDEESHNYVLGAFTCKEVAAISGDVERTYRGCKYEPKVTECLLDNLEGDKIKYHESCK